MKPSTLILTSCVLVLSGCATVPNKNGTESANTDPWEGFNRGAFLFNEKFDEHFFQPVARTYANYVPSFVQTGVGNFFGNINDLKAAANSFLQGNVAEGFSDLMRFGLNSTFGLLGVLDIASEAKIPKHHTDFGQTLGVWGLPNGPYLVIPFLGPSVVRDAAALPVDNYSDLWTYEKPTYVRNIGTGLRLVDKRAGFLDSYFLLENAALDKYSFIRDAYLQRVSGQIESRKNASRDFGVPELRNQEKMNANENANAKSNAIQP